MFLIVVKVQTLEAIAQGVLVLLKISCFRLFVVHFTRISLLKYRSKVLNIDDFGAFIKCRLHTTTNPTCFVYFSTNEY
jgi:hypothetical protein